MSNKLHGALNSSSPLPTVQVTTITTTTTTTNERIVRRKNMWIYFGIIAGILIITAIVVPITIIFTKEPNEIETTITTTTTLKTTTTITTKAPMKTTTNIPGATTTKSEQKFNDTGNIVTIVRLKFTDSVIGQTRYWYQTANETIGISWTMDSPIFRLYTEQVPETDPIHLYYSKAGHIWHNILQMDPNASSLEPGKWEPMDRTFYCYKTSVPLLKLQPIRRYWRESKFHAQSGTLQRLYLLTGEKENEQQPGWTFDKIMMYALPLE